MACVKLVKKMGWEGTGKRVVTILSGRLLLSSDIRIADWNPRCDSGTRHYSKFWSDEYLQKAEIRVDLSLVEDLLKKSEGIIA